MLPQLRCPITGETILKVMPRGISRTSLYSEIFFLLYDGSKMKVAISRNAKKNLNLKKARELFEKIRKERIAKLKTNDTDLKRKMKNKIEKTDFKKIISRQGLSLSK